MFPLFISFIDNGCVPTREAPGTSSLANKLVKEVVRRHYNKAIKRNESNVGNIDFEIHPIIV